VSRWDGRGPQPTRGLLTPSRASAPWFNHPDRRVHAGLRLYCFPPAGGSASTFRSWSRALPSDVEVCPVQLPGRENRLRDAPFVKSAPLVRALADVLGDASNVPFAFFGHSMGALIGYELARELRRRRQPGPARLYVSGHRAPHLPSKRAPIHHLPQAPFIAELRRLNGTPEQILEHPELRELVMPALRADFAVCETYVHTPGDPLACPIVAFAGRSDRLASPADMAPWREHTRAFELHVLPGNHFFLRSAQDLILKAISVDAAVLQRG
jgi:medium-chain acyl-[acyl-carrier-protein] hydrolase